MTERLRQAEDFCTEAKTKEIKTDLTRHLTGDFTPPARQKADDGGSWLSLPPNKAPVMDRERIFDPGPRTPPSPS